MQNYRTIHNVWNKTNTISGFVLKLQNRETLKTHLKYGVQN